MRRTPSVPRAWGSDRDRSPALHARSRLGPPRAARACCGAEKCEVCGSSLSEDQPPPAGARRTRILCACEPCHRDARRRRQLLPLGTRTVGSTTSTSPDELWAAFQLPDRPGRLPASTGTNSWWHSTEPRRAHRVRLHLESCRRSWRATRILAALTPTARLGRQSHDRSAEHAIVPIDECYQRLVGPDQVPIGGPSPAGTLYLMRCLSSSNTYAVGRNS